ncbi:MAG: phosphatidylglycerophosphatase A, partial [Desulfovibrionales bacterium]
MSVSLPPSPVALLDRLAKEVCTLGPVGHLPWAPGTWGSLVAVVFAPWLFLLLSIPLRLLVVAVIFILGGMAASRVERQTGVKDPGMVVVDELAGQWLTLLPFATLHPVHLGLAFVLFRLFDIVKPWPVRRSEHWLPN